MRTKSLVFCFPLLALSLFAEDIAQPTFKKEHLPSIPHVWVSEAALLLKAKNSGLSYANTPQNTGGATDFLEGEGLSPKFNWKYGFRIDVGYQPKDWLFFAAWTYAPTKAEGSQYTNGSLGFFPLLSLNPANNSHTYVTSGDVFWKLNTNLVDAGASIAWRPVKHFILKHHIGLRFASLNQQVQANYGGGEFNQGIDHIQMSNDFLGVGPRLGLCPNILLPKGFSIVGDVSISGLLGGFWVKQKETYLNNNLYHHNYSMARLRGILDAKAALAWEKELLYKALVFSVQAGWEWHEFFAQNQLHYSDLNTVGSKNIILQGAFVSLCLGF